MIGLDPLGGAQRSLETSRLQGGEQSLRYRLVDLHAPDGQAVQALSLKDVLPGAVITRRGLSSPVAGTQPPAAVAARRAALQQRAALSDGAARCIPLRTRVPGDALEVLFIGGPVDIARVVLGDQRAGIASPLPSKGRKHAGSGYRRAFTMTGNRCSTSRNRCSTSSEKPSPSGVGLAYDCRIGFSTAQTPSWASIANSVRNLIKGCLGTSVRGQSPPRQ